MYKDREGHCRVPIKHTENHYPLGQWVATQRSRAGSPERHKQLDRLGFILDPLEADWEDGLNFLKSYKNREGHCRVPQRHKEDGYRLGQWVSVQRTKLNTLSEKKRRRLDDLGFIWNILDADWEECFNLLNSYKDREGHCLVPTTYRENGFALGRWVSQQRSERKTLAAKRRQRLDDLGFVWNKLDNAWELGLSHLTRYRDRVGHCRVPKNYREDDYALGQWVINQRMRASTLSSERRRRLDELGFVWDTRHS